MVAFKAPVYTVIVHDQDAPPVVQAANIALLALRAARCNDWVTLGSDETRRNFIIMDAEQQQLLADHHRILGFLSLSPLRTVYACNTCHREALTDGAGTSVKCNLTFGCLGETKKAANRTAKAVK